MFSWAGLSAELIANRKFGVPPACDAKGSYSCWPQEVQDVVTMSAGFAPRWQALGSATLSEPWYGPNISGMVVGDCGHSVSCRVKGTATSVCGVQQSAYFDGFDAGMSFGSAIVLQEGELYNIRLVLGILDSETVVTASLQDEGGTIWQKELRAGAVIPPSGSWTVITQNFTAPRTSLNATLKVGCSNELLMLCG